MTRTKWKGPYIETKLLAHLEKKSNQFKNKINATSRNSEIIPCFVGMTFHIYNGKTFLKVIVTEEMIGHKFGEFSPTRKKFSFKKK